LLEAHLRDVDDIPTLGPESLNNAKRDTLIEE